MLRAGYVEQTYDGNRKQPMSQHSMWKKYHIDPDDDAMTTNAAEGFNTALTLSIPRNCSVWTLIKQLQTEESSSGKKLMDAALGGQNNQATNPNTSRNIRQTQSREQLKHLVSSYHNISIELYISSLIDFYQS